MSLSMEQITLNAFESILHHTKKDDIAFLVLILVSGLVYTLFIRDKPDPFDYVWYEKPQVIDANAKGSETRDIGKKLDEINKNFAIVWGSQSGTAEGLANRLARDCRSRFGLDALVADLSDYDPESFSNIPETKLVIFIVSTYGEGDPSDNTTNFLSWLESNKTIRFPSLRYAAFGLGNSKYKYYNKVIDIVTERLDHFGATPLMLTGKGDDATGATNEDFTEWKQSLFALFREQLHFEEKPEQYEPTLSVVQDTSLDIIDLHMGEPIKPHSKKGASTMSTIHPLAIQKAIKLLGTTDRNCLHMELDTSDFPELKYKTGDHLAVYPSNPATEKERLAKLLGLQDVMHTPLLISSTEPSLKVKVPSPTTWDALFQHYLEICSPVARETVLALAQFAPSDSAKVRLTQLGEDREVYAQYCSRTHITLGRLLEGVSGLEGSWSTIPLSFILESLPLLSPRYYSISSSSVVSPKKISITIATSSEVSPPLEAPIPGLTTEYLLQIEQKRRHIATAAAAPYNISGPNNVLEQGGKVFAHIRKSKFRLPLLPKTPIIMVASGSGIAPFRGFITERARLASIGGREVAKSILLFGCRSQEDYLYQEELEALENSREEVKIITAFSRTGTNRKGGKYYVQDRLEESDEQIIDLLMEHNAYFYICGSAGMARDVASRLGECLQRRKGWSEGQLREWSEGMRRTHRWQEDVWG